MVYINLNKIKQQVTVSSVYGYFDQSLQNELEASDIQGMIDDCFTTWEDFGIDTLDELCENVDLSDSVETAIENAMEGLDIETRQIQQANDMSDVFTAARKYAKDVLIGGIQDAIRTAVVNEYGKDPLNSSDYEGFE